MILSGVDGICHIGVPFIGVNGYAIGGRTERPGRQAANSNGQLNNTEKMQENVSERDILIIHSFFFACYCTLLSVHSRHIDNGRRKSVISIVIALHIHTQRRDAYRKKGFDAKKTKL